MNVSFPNEEHCFSFYSAAGTIQPQPCQGTKTSLGKSKRDVEVFVSCFCSVEYGRLSVRLILHLDHLDLGRLGLNHCLYR
jgi:hypothetical protein